MTDHSAEHQAIVTDLLTWIRQNRALGAEWYLDEGELPEVTPVAPAKAAQTAAPSPEAVPVAGVATPEKPAVASPAAAGTPVTDKEAVFKALCDRFVADTLTLIAREQATAPTQVEETLLAAHGGDAEAAMAALRDEVLPCTACELSGSRHSTVFGAGNPRADVVFIGEAPGRDEDREGEPFVGASGQLLTKILGAIGFAREDVFICNILKCRPPNNRDPQPQEVLRCEPHLKRQLAILQPRVICCLGRVAAQTLLKSDLSLGKLRRTVHFYQGIPVMATFHPAALLRNPKWKRDTWEDVRKLRALCDALSASEV